MAKYFEPISGTGAERRDGLGDVSEYRKHPHRGSDWGFKPQSAGKPVKAIADGKVTRILWSDVLGNCVITRNTADKVYILYAHLQNKTTLQLGDPVIGGVTVIGKIGSTGSAATGAHLHAAASKDALPHLTLYTNLLDLFKLINASKPKPAAKKPTTKKATK